MSGWGSMFDALSASRNERGEGEVKETGSIRLFCFAVVMVALLLTARELERGVSSGRCALVCTSSLCQRGPPPGSLDHPHNPKTCWRQIRKLWAAECEPSGPFKAFVKFSGPKKIGVLDKT